MGTVPAATLPSSRESGVPACGVQSDFLVRSEALLMPVRPADCAAITQTPPEFTWPPVAGDGITYEVLLAFPDGHEERRSTAHNWLAWDVPLPQGAYRWRVRSYPDKDVSAPRRFTIAASPVEFRAPAGDEALRRARAAPHPRTWSRGPDSPLPALHHERALGFGALLQEVDGKYGRPVQPEPRSASIGSNYEDTVAEQKRTLAAALAYAGSGNPHYLGEAVRRLLAQAGWSTTGPIGFAANDMASRNVAWTLALGYDWLHDELQPQERARILEAIRVRTGDMYQRYVRSGEITKYPYDSHGNLSLAITAAIGLLVAGDLPEADSWVKEALPMAVMSTSPWGGPDGGFANGTTQGQWDTCSNLLAWYVFRNAAGVEMQRREWVRNHAAFLAYFVPPGAPAGLFGDGQEEKLDELWARTAKALAAFAPAPMAQWYASRLKGEDDSRLELLLAPRGKGDDTRRVAAPPSAVFPSIGWTAMHSDLADPRRTSVYFKSSPYGSYNHAHADQNSFVIDHAGHRLAIASGYYDGYGTAHWKDWYKQTRAANAITFDDGQGQAVNDKASAGKLLRFERRDGYDYVVGDATAAYGGTLKRALRTLVYLRPGLVLVHDVLASDEPRRWEWNLHAFERMEKLSDTRVQVSHDGDAMCVEMVAAPPVSFEEDDRFTTPPQESGSKEDKPPQWHGRFATTERLREAEFVALLHVGERCGAPSAPARRVDGGWAVATPLRTLRLGADDVS